MLDERSALKACGLPNAITVGLLDRFDSGHLGSSLQSN